MNEAELFMRFQTKIRQNKNFILQPLSREITDASDLFLCFLLTYISYKCNI